MELKLKLSDEKDATMGGGRMSMEYMLSKEAQALLTPCPKCGERDMLQAESDRCAEDCFGVFISCKRCGDYFPGTFMDYVETAWGMEDWAVRAAMEIWNEQLVAP